MNKGINLVKIHDGLLPTQAQKQQIPGIRFSPSPFPPQHNKPITENRTTSEKTHEQQVCQLSDDALAVLGEERDDLRDEVRGAGVLQLLELLELIVQQTLTPKTERNPVSHKPNSSPNTRIPAVVQRRETLTVAYMLLTRAASWYAADMAAAGFDFEHRAGVVEEGGAASSSSGIREREWE